MIGLIAAVSQNNVIGLDGKIPFDYPEDLAHFKKTTLNSVIIMGRITFEGIGRPLPHRINIVITSKTLENDKILTFPSIDEAMFSQTILTCQSNIWFIGGNRIYQEGMQYAETILLTRTPEIELSPRAIKFPDINPQQFKLINSLPFEGSPLWLEEYRKIEIV